MELYHHNAERKHQRRTTDGHLKVFHCMSSCNMETDPKKIHRHNESDTKEELFTATVEWFRGIGKGSRKVHRSRFSVCSVPTTTFTEAYGIGWMSHLQSARSVDVWTALWMCTRNPPSFGLFSSTDIWYLFCASPTREHRWIEFEFLVKLSLARGIGWQIEHERFKLTFQFPCWHWEIISPEFPRAALQQLDYDYPRWCATTFSGDVWQLVIQEEIAEWNRSTVWIDKRTIAGELLL